MASAITSLNSALATVGAASVLFATVMGGDEVWEFCSSTACFIQQGAAPVASAASGSIFVPAGARVLVFGGQGARLAVIQQTAGGPATLSRVLFI